MSIKFLCCFCGHKLKAPPALAGERAKCPRCAKAVTVPRSEGKASPQGTWLAQPLPKPDAPDPAQAPSRSSPLSAISRLTGLRNVVWFRVGGVALAGILVVVAFALLMPRRSANEEGTARASPNQTAARATPIADKEPSRPAANETAEKEPSKPAHTQTQAKEPMPPADMDNGARKPVPTPSGPVVSVPAPTLRKTLEHGLRVTGTLGRQPHTETFGDQKWSGQRWIILLQLVNETPLTLDLGKDLLLYEADAKVVNINGAALFRGQGGKKDPPAHLLELAAAEPFGLGDNYLVFGDDGDLVHVRGPRTRINNLERRPDGGATVFDAPPSISDNPGEDPTKSFGTLGPKQARPVRLHLSQGRWLPQEALKQVFVVLPEISVSGQAPSGSAAGADRAAQTERFRVVVQFRPAAGGRSWEPCALQIIGVEAEEMARLLENADTNLVVRLCLANWLMDIAPEKGSATLSRVASGLQGEPLLATCLQLMAEAKTPGMERQAQELMRQAKAPAAIRCWCAVYLGVLKHEPGFKALVTALDDRDPEAVEGAIHGLGAYGGPAASRILLERLRKAKLPDETALLADNLLFTKDHSPHVLKGLIDLAERGNVEVLEAMAQSGPPQLFPFFQARARHEKKWQAIVVQGLCRTGGEKAVPVLLNMLEKDPPPQSPSQRSELVESVVAFASLESPSFVAGIVRLAEKGNLSALQVLAELRDEAARPVLTRLARMGTPAQAEIAVEGLVENWPGESFATFREALKTNRPAIVCLALQGLGRSQTAAARALITPYLTHANNEVRSAAGAAVRDLSN